MSQPNQGDTIYTREQVSKHNTKEDCWTIVHGKVYDVTKYLEKHPGGVKLLFRNAGKDSTSDFEATYHSMKARALLEPFLVGKLNEHSGVTSTTPNHLTRFANVNNVEVNPYNMKRGGGTGPYGLGGYNSAGASGGLAAPQIFKPPRAPIRPSLPSASTGNLTAPQIQLSVSPAASSATTTTAVSAAIQNPEMKVKLMSKTNFKPYKLVHITKESPDTMVFKFQLPVADKRLKLPLGKHIQVACQVEKEQVVRKYTPVNVDEKGHFELMIKKYEQGVMSTYFHGLKVGDSVMMRGYFGTYEYVPHKFKNMVMIAGGTGIAPVYQIIKKLVHENKKTSQKTNMVLLYSNKTSGDILLKKELDLLQKQAAFNDLHIQYFLTRSSEAEPSFKQGRITQAGLEEVVKSLPKSSIQTEGQQQLAETQFLMCGTDEFCDTIRQYLNNIGAKQEQIHQF